MTESTLFSPYTMRGLTFDNRLVLSPMCQYAATDGTASDWHLVHLGGYALGNLGCIITEATAVEPVGRISPQCLGLYSDENQEALERVIRFCRQHGTAKFGVQLAHAGRKSSVPPSFMVRKGLTPDEGGWTPITPSDYADGIHPKPQVMDQELIERVKIAWRDSTRRCAQLGVDLIELHFAHGYLVNEFMSPLVNKRDDAYGGSIENRMRLALEIFDICRPEFPADRPIGVRISATDWVPGGWDIEDSIVLARELKKRGCDYICCTSGGVSLKQEIKSGPGYQVPFAQAIREQTGMASMAVGQIIEAKQAEAIVDEGKADMVAIGRKLLYNPHWAWTAAHELGVFLQYPPRYRSCHPRTGPRLLFPEEAAKTQQLADLEREAAKRSARG
jgi:2,4-dienoyl-CoA reductase-like NADH-dependent reductase (Old Yellow Enzyme family)